MSTMHLRTFCWVSLLTVLAINVSAAEPGPRPVKKPPTSDDVAAVLSPNGPHLPRIVPKDRLERVKLTAPNVSTVLEEDLPPSLENRNRVGTRLSVLKRLPSKEPASEEATEEWLQSLKVGDTVDVLRDLVVRQGQRYKFDNERSSLTILSNAEFARQFASAKKDAVEGWTDTTIQLNQSSVQLVSRKNKDGGTVLALKAVLCAVERPLRTTKLKIAVGDDSIELPLLENEIIREYRGAQPCEEVLTNISDRTDLQMLIANATGEHPLIVRFTGPRESGDVDVSAPELFSLRYVLTIYHADRAAK